MGAEIALCFAMSGHDVFIKDATRALAEMGKKRLDGVLDKSIKKGRFQAEDKAPTLARITPTDTYADFNDVDLVVEAVFEDVEIKKGVFAALDDVCKPSCVFATNTSSIPITLLATAVKEQRKPQFIGTHFFSPASVMKLVEVIPALETGEETVIFTMDWCRAIGKAPVRIKDVPGFAVNRLLHVMVIEANRLVEEGVATPEDIDTACKLGLGHPIGPFTLMDLTDLSLSLKVQEIMCNAYGERFRPRPILKQKVNAGHLGRKVGHGWFKYT
jgi:3-hydroxybutyryl-CoA dehydrogenase